MSQPPREPPLIHSGGAHIDASTPQRQHFPRPRGRQEPRSPTAGRKHPREESNGDSHRHSGGRNTRGRDLYIPEYSNYTTPRSPRGALHNQNPRHVLCSDNTGAHSTQAPVLSLPTRQDQAVRPDVGSTMPMRGSAPGSVYSEHVPSTEGVHPPAVDPLVVNAAVYQGHGTLPNGLHPKGPASPRDFFPGGTFWGPHHATALDTRHSPRDNKGFVQTGISVASCKRRMFFTDFAHDDGIQAYPMFTHGHNGLNKMPEHLLKYHIPVIDWDDHHYVPWHPHYNAIRVRQHNGKPLGQDVSINISMSYPLNLMEHIVPVGWASEADARFVNDMADRIRDHGRLIGYQFANPAKQRAGRSGYESLDEPSSKGSNELDY